MKRFLFIPYTLCLFTLASMCFALPVFPAGPAASAITSYSEIQIKGGTRFIYTIPTVAASDEIVFKIPTLDMAGEIDAVYFVPATSDDCDVWLSGLDAQLASDGPVFHFTGVDTDGWNPEMKDRDYVNMDTPQVRLQYLTIKNDDAVNATGSSTLIIDFNRN